MEHQTVACSNYHTLQTRLAGLEALLISLKPVSASGLPGSLSLRRATCLAGSGRLPEHRDEA
jgi:hypothetical protein